MNKGSCSEFDINLLFQLTKAAKVLIANTLPSDVLLFLGNTPNFLYHILKQNGRKNVIEVPFSGRPYELNRNTQMPNNPTNSGLKNYCSLLTELGITKDLITSNNLYIVDYTTTGISIVAFIKILHICFEVPVAEQKPIKMIMLQDTSTTMEPRYRIAKILESLRTSKKKPYVNLVSILGVSKLDGLANDRYPRTVPYYPSSKWNMRPEEIDDIGCIRKLLYFNTLYDELNEIVSEKNEAISELISKSSDLDTQKINDSMKAVKELRTSFTEKKWLLKKALHKELKATTILKEGHWAGWKEVEEGEPIEESIKKANLLVETLKAEMFETNEQYKAAVSTFEEVISERGDSGLRVKSTSLALLKAVTTLLSFIIDNYPSGSLVKKEQFLADIKDEIVDLELIKQLLFNISNANYGAVTYVDMATLGAGSVPAADNISTTVSIKGGKQTRRLKYKTTKHQISNKA